MKSLLSVVSVLLAACAASAQPSAQISGVVQDPSGAAVAGASVIIMHLDSGLSRSVMTGGDGSYGVSSLPSGEYKITVRKPGFRTLTTFGLTLRANEARTADFGLEIGSMQEVITVEGAVSVINTEDATSGITITEEEVRRLPVNGRTLAGVLPFAPGILPTPATLGEAGQFSANGQRPNANYFTVDGVSANFGLGAAGVPGQFSGGTLPVMTAAGSLHALASMAETREIRVQTSTYAPEFGRMPGAQVEVTTRSGSNDLHGQLYYGLRSGKLAANDWFANRAGLGHRGQSLHDVNASLGGAIIPNKTFYFASLEVLRLQDSAVARVAVPSIAIRQAAPAARRQLLDLYPRPQFSLGSETDFGEAVVRTSLPSHVSTGSLRIDQAVGSMGALFLRYSDTPSSNRLGSIQVNEARLHSRSFTAGLTLSTSPSITHETRLAAASNSARSTWLGQQEAAPVFQNLLPLNVPGQRLYGLIIEGLDPLILGDMNRSRQRLFQLAHTAAFSSGRHQSRIGIDYQRLSPVRESDISVVAGRFQSAREAASGTDPTLAYSSASAGSSVIETLSLFAQDTWNASPRFNLTYGVRWEVTPAPAFRSSSNPPQTIQAAAAAENAAAGMAAGVPEPFWETRYTQFAPRMGVAYRLGGERPFVLRAGAGVFYDLGFAATTDRLNGAPFNSWRIPLIFQGLFQPHEISYGFAQNLRLPYSAQWNVTIERATRAGGIVSVAYVGSASSRLLRREGVMDPFGLPAAVVATNRGHSSYHALELQARRRLAAGIRGIVSYSWSHSIDNGSWDSAVYLASRGSDRGSSNFDVRHSAVVGLSYEMPQLGLAGFGRGWTVSTILRARTGFPIDILAEENAFGLGFDNMPRPDLVPGVPVWLAEEQTPGARRINPAAFRRPPEGQQGSLGRNALRGYGLFQADLAVERRFALRGDSTLELRLESYNFTNRPMFADPVRILSSPLFGQAVYSGNLMMGSGRPNSGLTPGFQPGGPRTVQVSLSWRF